MASRLLPAGPMDSLPLRVRFLTGRIFVGSMARVITVKRGGFRFWPVTPCRREMRERVFTIRFAPWMI